MSCVQEEEKDRINQFVFVEDATQALVSRIYSLKSAYQLIYFSNRLVDCY